MDRSSCTWYVRCAAVLIAGVLLPTRTHATDPPCDRYPSSKQGRCQAIWKELNDQAVSEVAQFGLAQQRRRDAGQLTAEQHLAENMAFIKQSTERRLKRLAERMAAER